MVAPPGEPTARNGPAVPQHDRRRHAAARPLAGGRQVRVGDARGERREVEVGQLVVQQEPAAGHDHAVAAGLLDRQRVRGDVAPAVGGRRGASSTGPRGRRSPGSRGRDRRAAGVVAPSGVPGATGSASACRGSIGAEALVGEALRQQLPLAARPRRRGRPGRRCTGCGRRRRAGWPRGSSAAPALGRARRAGRSRGCSAPRRPSCRRWTTARMPYTSSPR